MTSALDLLKKHTLVVADTGDFQQLEQYKPQDSTTNPSLIYSAASLPQYKELVDKAVAYGRESGSTPSERLDNAMDKLAVLFGLEILKIVPGRVSTEIDARLSFDTEGTIARVHKIKKLYEEAGINTGERVLFKIASTWEGIQAAKVLEAEGIHVNMTLLFCLAQAVACADVGATLISPFAGRITDFFKQKEGKSSYEPAEDPGVISVGTIYNYYKKYGFKTVVMGASFRSKEQVMHLCGCDLLTISPTILKLLADTSDAEVPRRLCPEKAKEMDIPELKIDQKTFLWELNEDEMAHTKLAEGIRKFSADLVKLEKIVNEKLTA